MEKLFVSGDYEEEPASLSVPLLVVLLHAQLVSSLHHRSNQRHVAIGPALLRSIGMHPTENKSGFVRLFYFRFRIFRIAIVLRVYAASIGVGVR